MVVSEREKVLRNYTTGELIREVARRLKYYPKSDIKSADDLITKYRKFVQRNGE